ncbi:ribosomal protein S18-alanine N-acetyltransferase [Shewanella sedimentimangrovi]|uniref:[Ribosomal protein bS18]-alanine N-acetyltransferase n=1 Tax=Shewanella sedimentimangrovi TaxID=2814293 RepID=A0ABX7QY08_9GAMM|nr:ribosomal protein S18-alanine N-acetyltransferase [Shewanella sedimentimangrovi]QSX36339.1 ribosomal protein S18-alanine N-acetyltransferase [Shewanella sedimentimangrovi]
MSDIIMLQPDSVAEMAVIESLAHSHPWSEQALADCFGPLYRVYGYQDTEGLLGFAIVQQIVDEVSLLDICVLPSHQGQGIGARLLDTLIADAQDNQASVIMLEVRSGNQTALELYQRHGFVETGRRKGYYPAADGREDAVLMNLPLA